MELNDVLNGKINEEGKKFISNLNENQRNALLDIFNVEYKRLEKRMDTLISYYSILPYFEVEFYDVDRVSIVHLGFSISHKASSEGIVNQSLFIPVLNTLYDIAVYEGDEYLVYDKYDIIVNNNIYDIITNQYLDDKYKENLMNINNDFFQFLNDTYYKYLDGIVEKFGIEFFRDNIKFIPSINFDDEGKFDNLGVRLLCVNTSDEALTKFSDVLDLNWTPFEDEVTQIIYSV